MRRPLQLLNFADDANIEEGGWGCQYVVPTIIQLGNCYTRSASSSRCFAASDVTLKNLPLMPFALTAVWLTTRLPLHPLKYCCTYSLKLGDSIRIGRHTPCKHPLRIIFAV